MRCESPDIPIEGIPSGKIEKVKNTINSLHSYIYPNVKFELITNEFGGKKYIFVAVFRQTGGPFMVSEKAERDKEIRNMFKALGIIESFGTGIGEAKRALERNGSPELYYKYFSEGANITSVVIPADEEYLKLKSKSNSKRKVGIDAQFQDIKSIIVNSNYKSNIKQNLLTIYDEVGDEIFGNARVSSILSCSDNTATAYIKKLYNDLKIIKPVEGQGKENISLSNKIRFVTMQYHFQALHFQPCRRDFS